MPIKPNASREEVFHEFRHGKTYARTRKKFGKKKARKQMIAVAMKYRKGGSKRKKSHRTRTHKKGAKR